MVQDCLHLDGDQAGYLGRLEVGWAMVKLQRRWFFPFLVKLPLLRLEKGSATALLEIRISKLGTPNKPEAPNPNDPNGRPAAFWSFGPLYFAILSSFVLRISGFGTPSGNQSCHNGYWSRILAGHLRTHGYEVAEEVPVGGGKTIDLVATRDGKRVAFEIETGKSDAAANVRKCLAARMDKVVVIATSAAVRDSLRRRAGLPPALEVATGTEFVAEGILTRRARRSQRSSAQRGFHPC